MICFTAYVICSGRIGIKSTVEFRRILQTAEALERLKLAKKVRALRFYLELSRPVYALYFGDSRNLELAKM